MEHLGVRSELFRLSLGGRSETTIVFRCSLRGRHFRPEAPSCLSAFCLETDDAPALLPFVLLCFREAMLGILKRDSELLSQGAFTSASFEVSSFDLSLGLSERGRRHRSN